MIQSGTCDVCDREDRSIGVASLPYAPMSVAFCKECLQENAYPLWSLHAGAEMNDGYEGCVDWFKELRSFKNGKYIDGPEVIALYEDEMKKNPRKTCKDCGGYGEVSTDNPGFYDLIPCETCLGTGRELTPKEVIHENKVPLP